jgi:hypothetical protein
VRRREKSTQVERDVEKRRKTKRSGEKLRTREKCREEEIIIQKKRETLRRGEKL